MTVYDFYADWCNPCKSLASILEKVTSERNIEVKKINIEEDMEDLAIEYGIRNIPTVIVIDDNDNELKRFTGTKTETDLNKFFDELS